MNAKRLSRRYVLATSLVIFVGICVGAGSASRGSPANGLTADVARTTESSGDVEMARTAMDRGDLRLAMNHLARRLDRAPGDGEALTLLVDCVRRGTEDASSCGDYVAAMGFVEQLRQRVDAARQERFASSAPITPLNDLTRAEEAVESVSAAITESADAQARPYIDNALQLANEAHYWWKPNDRGRIREALRQLRWVCERGQAISKDTTGRYYEALNRLKGMVANSEWDSLRAEAGFVQ